MVEGVTRCDQHDPRPFPCSVCSSDLVIGDSSFTLWPLYHLWWLNIGRLWENVLILFSDSKA